MCCASWSCGGFCNDLANWALHYVSLEMVWGFFIVRMLWGYIGTNLPHFVYYYVPTVLWDNVVPLILWMYIADFVISLSMNLVLEIPTHSLA